MKLHLLPALALVLLGLSACEPSRPDAGSAPRPPGDLRVGQVRLGESKSGGRDLVVPIESAPGAVIATPEVRVDTYFFVRLPNGQIVLSSDRFQAAWKSAPIDWKDGDVETLEASVPKPTIGTFHGYIIGVYYKGTLQDLRAEPADLATAFPLPDTLPSLGTKK